jgi:hypothetical protein
VSYVRQWLAAKKKAKKYYVAILPEHDSPLLESIADEKDLGDLAVVACPEFTHADLAFVKTCIDEVREELARIRTRVLALT